MWSAVSAILDQDENSHAGVLAANLMLATAVGVELTVCVGGTDEVDVSPFQWPGRHRELGWTTQHLLCHREDERLNSPSQIEEGGQ